MPDLLTVSDPIDLHHFIDRIDAGIDNYRRTEMCEWLHSLVDRIEAAEDGLARAAGRFDEAASLAGRSGWPNVAEMFAGFAEEARADLTLARGADGDDPAPAEKGA